MALKKCVCVVLLQFVQEQVLPGHEDWVRDIEFTHEGNCAGEKVIKEAGWSYDYTKHLLVDMSACLHTLFHMHNCDLSLWSPYLIFRLP